MPLYLSDGESHIVDTRPVIRRVVGSLLLLSALLPPMYSSWKTYCADRILRTDRSIQRYDRAIEYDRANATYRWARGRVYHYSVEIIDIPHAIQDYEKALSLNPRLGQAWLDLADCYEQEGKLAKAEQAIENALRVRRFSPLAHWQAGNFYLRRGNLAKMYESFKLASEYDPSKLGIAMETTWKADADHKGILQKLIPDSLQANLRYMDFLLSRDELELARAAWERSLKNEMPSDFEYRVSSGFGYIDRLLARERFAEAQQVWDEALQKAGTGLRDTRSRSGSVKGASVSPPSELVWNGSFESEILRGGFDWRFPNMQDVHIQVDLTSRMEGLKSLKVTFTGSNVPLSEPHQIVPVPAPGEYRLEFYLKTDGLTTDQTPYLLVQGFPDAQSVTLRTGLFPPSSDWQKLSFNFVVRGNCRGIQLGLRRDSSTKFDNQIKGSLWLDGVSIRLTSPSDTVNSVRSLNAKSQN